MEGYRTIEDARLIVLDGIRYHGCGSWKSCLRLADDAKRIAAYASYRTAAHVNRFSGEHDGGPENELKAKKAEKTYRLAAWVLKRIAEGRDEHDVKVKAEEAVKEEARIAALPRVNKYGRPL